MIFYRTLMKQSRSSFSSISCNHFQLCSAFRPPFVTIRVYHVSKIMHMYAVVGITLWNWQKNSRLGIKILAKAVEGLLCKNQIPLCMHPIFFMILHSFYSFSFSFFFFFFPPLFKLDIKYCILNVSWNS